MTMICEDERKDFILTTAAHFFNVNVSDGQANDLLNNTNLNEFLDNGSCLILSISTPNSSSGKLSLDNKVVPKDGSSELIFFKICPDIITKDNIRSNIYVLSIAASPVSAFYHSIQKVFSPVLLKNDEWSQQFDPKLQELITQLESGLRLVLNGDEISANNKSKTSENTSVIMSPVDESSYWASVANSTSRRDLRDRSTAFWNALEPLGKDFSTLNSLSLIDIDDVLETAHNSLDDLWKLDEYPYPQPRMEHLLTITGNALSRFVQSHLKNIHLWEDPFSKVEELISQGINIGEKWIQTCERLTSLFWPNYTPHPWEGPPYSPVYVKNFVNRLQEILRLRTLHRQLIRLLSKSEQLELGTNDSFKPFEGLTPVQYNPYTESEWQTAVQKFESSLRPTEDRVASKLKMQFRSTKTNTLQLLYEFQRYEELIQRATVKTALLAERENLLGRLREYLISVASEFNSTEVPVYAQLLNMPEIVSMIYWIRQLESKVKEIQKTGSKILNDLNGYEELQKSSSDLLSELKEYHTERFDNWCREMNLSISNKTLSLLTDEPVVHFEQGKLMRVNYNPRLVQLDREVRQLAVLGYTIPTRIIDAATLARKFMRQAKALEQVANFHNTIGDRMIASQRPMMLDAALELANLVQEQNGVTWSNTEAVDHYIERLQTVVERLSRENNKLASYHIQIREKVIQLMNTDLLRHQQQWKEGLKSIRDIIGQVESQFSNLKSWKVHWDRQLYKALEHQYQVGLEALNDHLPEMKVELIYRQQKLQFRPPIEEIRMKYYGQLKRFLAIPHNFKGVGDGAENALFHVIIERNAPRFAHLFTRAEEVFAKLEKLKEHWLDWVALGSVDLDALAQEHLHTAEDWDRNFRASKAWGQEIGKLPGTEEKVECFAVSFLPVRAEIELHNRRYWDTLVTSLQSSIVRDVTTVEKFTVEATEALSHQPQTVEEIGTANQKHAEIMKKAPEIFSIVQEAEKKNKTLASWTKERVEQVNRMVTKWDNFQTMLDNHQYLISKQVEGIKSNLTVQVENMMGDLEKFRLRWEQARPREESLQDGDADALQHSLEIIREKRLEWEDLMQSCAQLQRDCDHFGMVSPDFKISEDIEADLKKNEDLWSLFEEFNSGLQALADEEWVIFRSKSYRFEEFLLQWQERLKSGKETTSLTVRLLQEVEKFKAVVPSLKYLRGEMFGEKHWMELFGLLGMLTKPIERLLFGDFLAVKGNIAGNLPALQDLNARAASEIVIRQALGELDIWEVEAKFSLTEHKDSQGQTVKLIKDFKDILNKVGDNQCLLQSIKNSPNYESFSDRASIWEQRLADLDVYLHHLTQIQRKWVYLEPIFGAGTLSQEKGRFQRVDHDFRNIMQDVARDSRVVSLCRINNLRRILDTLLDQLARCQKSLNDFLEEKRSAFPRFYFLGDDDLLEILGQSTKERVIQSHLKKLFSGINSVQFDSEVQNIIAMKSLEGETVALKQSVKLTQQVEEWLANLAKEMQMTLKKLLLECLEDSRSGGGGADPLKFPSQILCLAESVTFTERCEQAINGGDLQSLLSSLKEQLEAYTRLSLEWASGNKSEVTEDSVLELKLKALLLDTIHHISVVEHLIGQEVNSIDDWSWQRQLRFYVGKDGGLLVRMVDAQFQYTYEYQGNAPKLVHTPLTDKCYLTLTQGMHMGLGGNPYGPAGTGKTESVKALGGLLGRQVLVFNCDEGIDVKSMARIFVGLVKCGAWGCFDEFNRLEEATLSAISMQIQPIQLALKTGAKSVKLMEEEVPLDSNSGIFVTLNPAGKGYGGRQKLPDNLKQLFRPVAMSRPDNELIAEVILYCEGFKEAKLIGQKLVELFDLSKKLLTPQQHYDWGLRALKTVLGGCGAALKMAGRANLDSKEAEEEVVVRALRLNTLSKLTFADGTRFDALVRDVFPGVPFSTGGHDQLRLALHEACQELSLLPSDNQLRKCLELYEQLQQRMGVVVVGPSGSGKTTLCQLLKTALSKLGHVVHQHTINPKAMPRTQLLGQIDLDTRQWSDGVLTMSAQQVHAEPPEVHSWIVCDGDVDPEWIESLNSVLDDNRLLTLPSGWRIQFGPNVNFLFETHDLSYASPATVSRMGIIFLSDEDIDVKSLVTSWLTTQSDETTKFLSQLIEDYFYKGVNWIMQQGELVLPTSLIGVVQNGLSQLHGVTCRSHFIVAMITGLGGNLVPASQEAFAKQVFEWSGEYVPDPNRILYTYFNQQRDSLDTYTADSFDTVSDAISHDSLPLVMTADVKRTLDAIEIWLQTESRQHFLLVGPPGCGKSLMLTHCFAKMRATEIATIHCSAQITPQHVIQKLGQVCMVISSNTGRVYRPKNSEHLILYFKDLNLARPDKWGTSMLVEFLQQIVSYGGFYDANLEWVGLEHVQIVGSLAGGNTMGRHPLTPRFTSIMRIYTVGYPEKEQLKIIYGHCLAGVLQTCLPHHSIWGSASKVSLLAGSMIKIYDEVKNIFSQVVQNHYLFTPRVLTAWCLGLQRYEIPTHEKSADALLEVVVYEAQRLFRDKLVSDEHRSQFDTIVNQVMDQDWSKDGVVGKAMSAYYVTAGANTQIPAGAPLPPVGKPLGRMKTEDWTHIVERGIQIFGREGQTLDLLILPEVLDLVARVERVLSAPCGSLLLAGRAGVGRKSAVRIASALLGADLVTLKMGRGYSLKHFKNDLKNMMQLAGVEGQQLCLLLEDHQMVDMTFLDMVNSLLSSGEVPGLYNLEELESTVSPLKDLAAQEGFVGNPVSFFVNRVHKNLHVALIMDYTNTQFTATCESNPALYRQCSVMWQAGWSAATMQRVPQMLLAREVEEEAGAGAGAGSASGRGRGRRRRSSASEALVQGFQAIHAQAPRALGTPRRYVAFIHMYQRLYRAKKEHIMQRCQRLQAGVSKLTEAREVVAALKAEAAEQEQLLAEKQEKANAALQMITDTMRDANTHKMEMETLKEQTERENQQIVQRKAAIDEELAEVEPLIQEASAAVGNIKAEALSEIRSLRAPPDVIRDILEGVLRLMGIQDTSWNSMKTFLAKRGVKEDIRSFDARRIGAESRAPVEKLLRERGDSFEARTARRASQAAAPLAQWVTANVRYSRVLEKIRPLEREQQRLQHSLSATQDQVRQLSTGLTDVDRAVAELKSQLNSSTKEAAEIEIRLASAKETITAAEELVSKLDGEYRRWKAQLAELSQARRRLPTHALLAAAFVAYLSAAPEDERAARLRDWRRLLDHASAPAPAAAAPEHSDDDGDDDEHSGAHDAHAPAPAHDDGDDFSLTRFLGSEQQLLQWQAEGLPSDQLSLQNALIILKSCLRPLLVDPSSLASEWLKRHLQHLQLEVVSQHSPRFPTALELAIRFGKALIVQEVDAIDPILFPVLRGDFITQGPRKVVQLGDKLIDYNDGFQLFITTRNPEPGLSPDSAAIVTCVNFTTTWAGLTGQLLAAALRQERPELEERRRQLLQREDELRMRLDALQEALLQELAGAQGDILANAELLASLNRAKASGAEVAAALRESGALRAEAAAECDAFQPLAEFGATLYFALAALAQLGAAYRFSVAAFARLFQRALAASGDGAGAGAGAGSEARMEAQRQRLLQLVYQHASRALFKEHRLALAMHLLHRMFPDHAPHAEWALLTRQASPAARVDLSRVGEGRPAWLPDERAYDLHLLKAALPELYAELRLEEEATWQGFMHSGECEAAFPVQLRAVTAFQRVLALQALRPDRLHSALQQLALQTLRLPELSPPGLSLQQLLEEARAEEPVLLLLSAGAAPGDELRALAVATVGHERFHEVSLGQGQAEVALERLEAAARDGHWLCLSNLHLVTAWLPVLEKRLRALQPHAAFRLWLTAEPHPRFPPLLAQACLKVAYEAPQGVRRNLQRTLAAWGPEGLSGGGGSGGGSGSGGGALAAKALFALAWFHAVVQERRTFIPQGWAHFYEFSDADLRAAADTLRRLLQTGSPKWEFMQGLCESAIYGGRVDNAFDVRVLASYARDFFDADVLASGRRPLGPGIALPPSSNYRDFLTIVHQLSDKDQPAYFGLPANVERSWQRITSNEVIVQLRSLERPVEGSVRFDRDEWQKQLSPIMSLWKKLNQGSALLQMKAGAGPAAGAGEETPLAQFLRLELQAALALVQQVHRSLAGLSRVVRGSALPSADATRLAHDLMRQHSPEQWLRAWAGPGDPLLYVRSLTARAAAVLRWSERGAQQLLKEQCDLSDFLHPDSLLSALKQQTARELGVGVHELWPGVSWLRGGLAGARLPVTLVGLQLEGADFDGQRLRPNGPDSPSVRAAPPCTLAWVPKEGPQVYLSEKKISIPLYYTAEREKAVISLDVPCANDHDKWLQAGVAFFLKN